MLPSTILTLLSAVAATSAFPLRKRCNGTSPDNPPVINDPAVTPSLPVNGGETELEGPGNLPLKHIALGHGIQNYTCGAADAVARSAGALAVVWEIKSLYPGSGPDAVSTEVWAELTSKVLRSTDMPIGQASGDEGASPFPPDEALDIDGVGTVEFLGRHYFDAAGVPTFDLYGGSGPGAVLRAKKDAGIKAPPDADPGLTGSGAVDWLRLSDQGTSKGDVSLVFRVLTSGGNPAACASESQTDSVPYTAMYWFY